MKKLWLLLALLGATSGIAHADFLGEEVFTAKYRLSVAANTSTAAVVIDLSDTTNFPHKNSRELNIDSLRISVDKVAASTFTVKVGVVNFVNASTGSITWFYSEEGVVNVSNTNVIGFYDYRPDFIRARVNESSTQDTDGATPYIISNDTTSGSTTYQTDVRLPSMLAAGAIPARGDLVIFVQTGAGAVVANLKLQYHSK